MLVRSASVGLLAAVTIALAPRGAQSQTIPSPFRYVETRQEVGILVGRTSANTGRFGFGPSGGLRVGARWGVDLSGPLGFETVAAVIRGKRDVIDPNRLEGSRKIGEDDVTLGTVDARLRFTFPGERAWHNLQPYFVFGGGIAFDLSPTQALDAKLDSDNRFDFGTSFLGTLGVGSHYYLSERIALRADAIFSLWKIDTPPGFSDPNLGIDAVEKSQWVNGSHLTLAIVLRR